MKAKHLTLALSAVILLAACNMANKQYYIEGVTQFDGAKAYLYDYANKSAMDSVIVTNGMFTFEGVVDTPYLALIVIEGERFPFFVEPADTLFVNMIENEPVKGSPLNDAFNEYNEGNNVLFENYRIFVDSVATEVEKKSITQEDAQKLMEQREEKISALLDAHIETTLASHNNDAVGAYLLWQWLMNGERTNEQVDSIVQTVGGYVLDNKLVADFMEAYRKRQATGVGQPFLDFTVEYNGKSMSLSDYVGKGDYVLVDFWASWCGPCMKEIPVIKEVYDKYNGKGFQVLGVAVWDKPEDTQAAIERTGIQWPQIINAQAEATELYGIDAIPHIILFAPDGTIVARGLRGEKLINTVEEALKQ